MDGLLRLGLVVNEVEPGGFFCLPCPTRPFWDTFLWGAVSMGLIWAFCALGFAIRVHRRKG